VVIGADVQRVADDNRMLATSHVDMQKRIEELSSSSSAASGV
jgi:hypothetical protein